MNSRPQNFWMRMRQWRKQLASCYSIWRACIRQPLVNYLRKLWTTTKTPSTKHPPTGWSRNSLTYMPCSWASCTGCAARLPSRQTQWNTSSNCANNGAKATHTPSPRSVPLESAICPIWSCSSRRIMIRVTCCSIKRVWMIRSWVRPSSMLISRRVWVSVWWKIFIDSTTQKRFNTWQSST